MPKKEGTQSWEIEITPNGAGYAPSYFDNSYPFFGNKEQMADMVNIDLVDPNIITPGPLLQALTAGTQAGAITTLVRSILDIAVSSNLSFAIGGNKLQQITATTVTNAGIWPHTIDKGTVTGEDGEDVCYYKSNLYYFYNHSGSAGDIGKYDLATTFDDDWGSTVPTGATALLNAPHQAINGGDDVMYFANGNYIGTLDGTTLDTTALDFSTDSQVASITWNLDKVWIAVNRPNISGSNFNQSAIYTWNGVDPSWETDPVTINGVIGALYTKNGVVYVWWQEAGTSNRYNFGYHAGTTLMTLKTFSGTLPAYYQVSEEKGFLCWVTGGKKYMWGAADPAVSVRAFQHCASTYATSGGIGSPFGSSIIASMTGSNYILEKAGTSFTVTSSWKTIAFKVSSGGMISRISLIQVEVEPLLTGAKCDFTLKYNKGGKSKTLTQIAYSATAPTIWKILNNGPLLEDFQIWVDFANGSTSNNVKIRRIMILGEYCSNP